MKTDSKIIVLTPIKNESWILKQFLTITSLFADHIIIADQGSTDESKFICSQFEKVHLINNEVTKFNESGRQVLLIEMARSLFKNQKIVLLALDADEIFSANSLYAESVWEQIKSYPKGTTIYFEKPDLLPGVKKCVRYLDNFFPIGYVDDGIPHHPSLIHSQRIPRNDYGEKLFVDEIKILHFAHTRRNVQSSKLRYYSVIENIKKTTPVYSRRARYKCYFDEKFFYGKKEFEIIPQNWLKEWDDRRIILNNFEDPFFSWYDFEVLSYFKEFGAAKFYWDNIWCFDWETCRHKGIKEGKDAPDKKIHRPNILKIKMGRAMDLFYRFYKYIKN